MTSRSDLAGWRPLEFEPPAALVGQHTRMERLEAGHAPALHAANMVDPKMWRYLPYGPFPSLAAYTEWVRWAADSADPIFYAIRGAEDWAGVATLMRVDRGNGVIEIGHIALSSGLQRTPAATEAIHLLLGAGFDAGFRRVEWKCNVANAASRRAARRYGFRYEGTFRQHMVVKGANRDTAWFAMLDGDWPAIRAAHLAWLDPANFDAEGRQGTSLSEVVGTLAGEGASGE